MPYISNEKRDKIKERFDRDIAEHEIHIEHDSEVYRHILFKRPGTGCYHFSLVTSPQILLYTGDMGTFVFRRTHDMFSFFQKQLTHTPDFSYWHEKLEAVDKSDGSCEESKEILFERLREYISDDPDDGMDPSMKHEIRTFIDELEENGEDRHFVELYREAERFHIGPNTRPDFYFIDLWDYNYKEFTDRFIWACYAIQWGVHKYFANMPEVESGKLGGLTPLRSPGDV